MLLLLWFRIEAGYVSQDCVELNLCSAITVIVRTVNSNASQQAASCRLRSLLLLNDDGNIYILLILKVNLLSFIVEAQKYGKCRISALT